MMGRSRCFGLPVLIVGKKQRSVEDSYRVILRVVRSACVECRLQRSIQRARAGTRTRPCALLSFSLNFRRRAQRSSPPTMLVLLLLLLPCARYLSSVCACVRVVWYSTTFGIACNTYFNKQKAKHQFAGEIEYTFFLFFPPSPLSPAPLPCPSLLPIPQTRICYPHLSCSSSSPYAPPTASR